ncbi:MAG: right-handed parallel beta-helix repeat-containing protein [Clostridiales bacterium]|nr:right-handed parallel beta-helix repeat-containing protein [Clostridiales bacterium]
MDKTSIEELTNPELFGGRRYWKIPCTDKINQLYVNDNYGIRARYPNAGEELRLLNMDRTLREIILDGADVAQFEESDFDGSIMTVAIMWSESYLRVSGLSKDKENGLARVKISGDDSFVFAREGLTIRPRCGYHFENSMAFMDVSGEWFWSDAEDCVYYLPYANETVENTTVRIPYTEVLMSVAGELGSNVSGVHFEGLNFKYTKNEVVDGKVGGQANRNDNIETKRISGGVNDGRPVAALSFEYAQDITFSGNVFACMGGGAIDFVQGVFASTIEKNIFTSIGGNGILASATAYDINIVSKDEGTFIKDVKVENNYFTDIGWQDYDACAVIFNYGVNVSICHNTISNVRYTGISIGWGWVADTYPFLERFNVSYNRLTNCNGLLSDGGPIYSIGCMPNSKITNNYVGESYNSVWKYPEDISQAGQIWWANAGIYLDNYSGGDSDESKLMVENNYVAEDVNTQKYEDINAKKDRYGKVEYYKIIEAKESDKDAIFAASGVKEEGFSLLPKKAVLTGFRTNSKTVTTVYGYNLGESTEGTLIVKGKDGQTTQVKVDDLLEWTDRWISFESSEYQSGDVFLLKTDGYSTNRLYATMNVDQNECMYTRFEKDWNKDGRYDGAMTELARIGTVIPLEMNNFRASSTLNPNTPDFIGDGYTSSVWSMANNDPADAEGAWIAFDLADRGKVSKFLIYARAEVDQPECRQDFKVYGLKSDGSEILLYETPEDNVPVYASNDVFVLDMAAIGHADTVFSGFKIQKKLTSGGSAYLCIAEVVVL